MKSFGVATCSYGRPKILELFCASIGRLREEMDMFIPVVVVVSDKTDKDLCEAYHIHHIMQQNRPVTEKWNTGFGYLRSLGMDYAIVTGSDDIFSTPTLQSYLPIMEEGWDVIGVDRIHFYGTEGRHKGKLTVLQGTKMLGVGKCFSSQLLDKLEWKPWNVNKNWGMDAIASRAIEPYAKSYKIIEGGFIVDVKSEMNINSMNVFAKREAVAPERFYEILSLKEKQILDKL